MRSEAREAAYVEFVTARQTDLRRLAYALCGDWQEADAMLQRVLVKLYVAWPRLQREGTEEAFCRRLLVRSDPDRRLTPHAAPPSASHGSDVSDRPALVDALQRLPAKQRKAVLLHDWLGLSVEDTAEDLGTTASAVRRLLDRAAPMLADSQAREGR